VGVVQLDVETVGHPIAAVELRLAVQACRAVRAQAQVHPGVAHLVGLGGLGDHVVRRREHGVAGAVIAAERGARCAAARRQHQRFQSQAAIGQVGELEVAAAGIAGLEPLLCHVRLATRGHMQHVARAGIEVVPERLGALEARPAPG